MAEFTIRLAKRGDRKKIKKMLEDDVSYARVALRDLDHILSSRLVVVATDGRSLKGALVSIWPRKPYAWLDALAVEPSPLCDSVAGALLDAFEDRLVAAGVGEVLCSIEANDDGMARRWLQTRGFRVVNQFIRFEKKDFDVPAFDAPRVAITTADQGHLSLIHRIEKACFEPPWRDDRSRLREVMVRYPHFRVASIDGTIAGFAYSTIDGAKVGQFVHLAVDPASRGLNVAKELLADAIEFFGSQGVRHIETRTECKNKTARRLFTSFGFRRKGPHRDVFGKHLFPANRAADVPPFAPGENQPGGDRRSREEHRNRTA